MAHNYQRVLTRFLKASTRVTYQEVKEYLEDRDSLKMFATAVKLAGKKPGVKMFHDRAFIHSVKAAGFPRSDVQEWNTQLVAAHVAGFLELARADLVGAMDRRDIDASEIEYNGSTFNFITMR